jgi:hypothetical protein
VLDRRLESARTRDVVGVTDESRSLGRECVLRHHHRWSERVVVVVVGFFLSRGETSVWERASATEAVKGHTTSANPKESDVSYSPLRACEASESWMSPSRFAMNRCDVCGGVAAS